MLPSIYKKQDSKRSRPRKLLKSKSTTAPLAESKLSLHDIFSKTKHKSLSREKIKPKPQNTNDNINKILQKNHQRKKLLSLLNKPDETTPEDITKGYVVVYENKYDLQSIVSRINTDPLLLHSTLYKSLTTTFNNILVLNTSLKFFFEYKPNDVVSLHNVSIVHNSINTRESNLGLLPKVLVIKCDEFKKVYLVDMKKFSGKNEEKFHDRLVNKLTQSRDWTIQMSQMNTFNVMDMKYCIKWRIINKAKK